MRCQNFLPLSGSLSSEHVTRYQAARERFLRTSNSFMPSGTDAATTGTGSSLPGGAGSTTSSPGLKSIGECGDEFFERLARLATTPRGENAPPLTTYRTTSTEHGEIYQASSEYVDWLRRAFPGYGEQSPGYRPVPRSTAPRAGDGGPVSGRMGHFIP